MKKNGNIKRILTSVPALTLIAATAVFGAACNKAAEEVVSEVSSTVISEGSETVSEVVSEVSVEISEIATSVGEGETDFRLEVVYADGTAEYFAVSTDADNVGDALVDAGLVEGEESDYGLYIKTVNGVTADYDVDQTYWSFYIDGEYAQTGVDATLIEEGATYSLKVEK